MISKLTNNIEKAQLNSKDINSIIQEEHKERLWMAAGHMGQDQNNLIKSANVYYEELFKRESLFNELNQYKNSLNDEVNDAVHKIKSNELELENDKDILVEHQQHFNKICIKADSQRNIIEMKLDELSDEIIKSRDEAADQYMDSINGKLKKNERIYGTKTAQKRATMLKEEFKSKFINTWKQNKAKIEEQQNNIDKITTHIDSVNREKDKY